MIGRMVCHYKVLEKLGGGGMGVVYRAEDTKLGRTVALKFLSETILGGEGERARFMHEARAAASLNHPNICTVYEIDEFEDRPFIAMEYVDGRSLASIIEEGPLKLNDAIGIATQVAEGLHEAHERGIVHRDIKPSNVMVTDSGRAKIMDFGLAIAADQTRLTKEGTTIGTVAYMSPEQARGEKVDRRTDIWSLGAVLYEMITGRRPFSGDYDQAVMYGIINEDPEPPTALRTGVPMELERIVMKTLAKRVDERYQHADGMISDLRRLGRQIAGEGAAARTRGDAARTRDAVRDSDAVQTRDAARSRDAVRVGDGARAALGTHGDAPGERPTVEMRRKGRRGSRWLIVVACIVAAIVGGYVILKPVVIERQLVAAPKPIAVISFENMTGDPAYDYLRKAIPNLLITSLEQSKYLRVTTWERMRDLLKQMDREGVDIIDTELGLELCRLDGIDVIVTGSFVKAGNTFATDIKVLDVGTKELLKSASAQGDGVESILKRQVDDLSREIARGVGLSARRIAETQRPVEEVTTTSMEAYNYYLRGVEEYDKYYPDDARRFLEKAVGIDTTFAMAYLYLASTYGRLRDMDSRNEMYEKAMRHAGRATERERLYIEARYALVIENDGEKHERLLRELVLKYPKEKEAHYWLGLRADDTRERYDEAIDHYEKVLSLDPAYSPVLNAIAYLYIERGEYERALEYLVRYAAASPGDANPFDSMAELYFRMGNLDGAIAKYREAIEVKPDFYGSVAGTAYIYGVKGEYDSSLAWTNRLIEMVPTPGLRMYGLGWRSLIMFHTGRMREALGGIEAWEELLRSYTRYPTAAQKFFKGNYLTEAGRYDAAERAIAEWRRLIDRTMPEHPLVNEGWVRVHLGLIDIRTGRMEEAEEEARKLEALSAGIREKDPGNYEIFRNHFALFKGELFLARGLNDEAIQAVRDGPVGAIPAMNDLELIVHNFPLNRDVVARALIANRDLEAAAAEYERLIAFDPGSNDRRLRNPRYRYRLAKVYEETGRLEEAIEQYGRFLEIWKNADRDLPEYIDARQRLEVLAGVPKQSQP